MTSAVVLVGYRASGKSALGKALSRAWRQPMADLDRIVENLTGLSVATLFARFGEAHFRHLETVVLNATLDHGGYPIISTGGGVIESEANRQALIASPATVVYLQAPVAVLQSRLARNCGNRPSLTGADPAAEVAAMMARREPWYLAVADRVVDASAHRQQLISDLQDLRPDLELAS